MIRFFVLAFFSLSAFAQYPNKPVRIVVGYPPGGSGDFTTRLIADEMQKSLGVSVIAENKPGAGGNLAAVEVAKAAPDGYTVLNAWHHSINLALYKNPGYAHKDFLPVTKIATGPTIVVVNPSVPINNSRKPCRVKRNIPRNLRRGERGCQRTS